MDSNAFRGKSYGIPFSPIPMRGYYYNKNVLEASGAELPTSCMDFLDNVAPKIKAAGFDPIYGMGKNLWGLGLEVENFIADQFIANDTISKLNSNEITFPETAVIDAFEWQLALLENDFYNEDLLVGTYDGAVQAMMDGTAFMTAMSVNTMGRYSNEANAEYLGGLCLSESSNTALITPSNFMYLVNEETGLDNMEGAMAFFEWYMEEDNLTEHFSNLAAPCPYMNIDVEMWPYAIDLVNAYNEASFVYALEAGTKNTGSYAATVLAGTKTSEQAAGDMQTDFVDSAKAAGLEAFQ